MTAKLAKRPTVELDTLATGIREAHEACERDAQSAVEWAIRCGELLSEAKTSVKHCEWLPWLEANFPASTRTAQGYMRLAESNTQGLAHLGVEAALAELAEPRPAPDPHGPGGEHFRRSDGHGTPNERGARLGDDAEVVDAEVVDEGYEDVPQSRPPSQPSAPSPEPEGAPDPGPRVKCPTCGHMVVPSDIQTWKE